MVTRVGFTEMNQIRSTYSALLIFHTRDYKKMDKIILQSCGTIMLIFFF